MKLCWQTQVEAGEGGDRNQEVNFWFGQRPIIGYSRVGARRAMLPLDRRHLKYGNTGFEGHIQATSTFEERL
jgi:hypothetical protein